MRKKTELLSFAFHLTPHECQPLDVGLFGPLKRHWQQECHKFYQKHPSLVILKLNFNLVFRQAWLNAVSPANIYGGFKKAGVYPYNRSAVLTLESGSNNSSEEREENGAVSEDGHSQGEAIVSFSVAFILLLFIPIHSFFLTGGDLHSGDGNLGDGEGEGDLGVRDLKGDFPSWILTPLMLLLLLPSSSLPLSHAPIPIHSFFFNRWRSS